MAGHVCCKPCNRRQKAEQSLRTAFLTMTIHSVQIGLLGKWEWLRLLLKGYNCCKIMSGLPLPPCVQIKKAVFAISSILWNTFLSKTIQYIVKHQKSIKKLNTLLLGLCLDTARNGTSILHCKLGHNSLKNQKICHLLTNKHLLPLTQSSLYFFRFPLMFCIVTNEIESLSSCGIGLCSANFTATSASTLHNSEEVNS